MNTQEIATRLIEHCRKAQWEAAQKELYADDAVSIEEEASPAFAKETKGLAAIIEKGRTFDAMVEQHHSDVVVSEPLIAGDSFACTMAMDVTMKGRGRMQMSELCVYTVKDGKIVAEEFHM